MKRSSRPRATAELSKSLNHQLNTYVLAASATGVGLLTLAPPAEAKIIYTPAHAKLVSPLPVDLNRDGIVDFYLAEVGGSGLHGLSACQYLQTFSDGISCSQSSGGTNAIRAIYSKGWRFGAALRSGQEIQRGEQFGKSRVLLGGVRTDPPSYTTWYGPWLNGGKGVKHRYLGLKFKIKGRVHFGWARLEVTPTYRDFTTILTGYAYETIPDKGIIAGKTKGPDVTTVSPASLGHLAAGASAIPAWRRRGP
jgi:hypothetical protein